MRNDCNELAVGIDEFFFDLYNFREINNEQIDKYLALINKIQSFEKFNSTFTVDEKLSAREMELDMLNDIMVKSNDYINLLEKFIDRTYHKNELSSEQILN